MSTVADFPAPKRRIFDILKVREKPDKPFSVPVLISNKIEVKSNAHSWIKQACFGVKKQPIFNGATP